MADPLPWASPTSQKTPKKTPLSPLSQNVGMNGHGTEDNNY